MTDLLAAQTRLAGHMHLLGEGDKRFATSLLAARKPSPKQVEWIVKLGDRAVAASAPKAAPVTVDAARVFALLQTAKAAGLVWPKIRQSVEGVTLAIGLAGERSKYYGAAVVTGDVDAQTGKRAWYGVILPTGEYQPSRTASAAVVAAVVALAADPAGRAALHGRLTGSCCFCGRRLDTRESVGVGYGPVCAEKFGLPWGSTAEYETVKQDAVQAAQDAAGAADDGRGGDCDGSAEWNAMAAREAGYGAGGWDPMGDAAATGRYLDG